MIRKKSQKNKQGFTMVELLAVITILGIVSALAIVGISKLLENAKQEYYKATEKQVKTAAKSYIQNNRKYLPKSIGSKSTITLKTLQDSNYIKGVKDYSKQLCDVEKTYVQIFKYGQNKYTYTTYLECPNYNSRKVVKEEYTPAIDIKFIKTQQDSEEQMNDIKVAKAEITIKGSNDANLKLLSYNYIVYKDGSEVISSGSIEANYKEKITIKLDLNKYTPGTIKIKVGATNINGFSQTETKSAKYADTQPPTCIIKDEDKQENPKPWTNQTRKITVGCDDGNGSGCTRSEYTKTFNSSTNIGTITIKDEAGNKTNCKVSVNVDKTKPTITIKAYKRTSAGGKTGSAVATVKANNKTSTATMNTYSNTTNKWLNKTNYPYGIYYEVTYSDNLALSTKEWNYNALNLTSTDSQVNTIASGKGVVSISGTSGSQNVSLSGEGYRKAYYEVKDQAGNTSRINITAPIDRTAPVSPSINMYKWTSNSTRPTSTSGLTSYTNNTWSNRNVYTTASGSTDTISGLNSYQYTTTGKTANATNETGQTRSIEAEGISTIKYRACDKAGNCSAYTTEKTIKLDKTAPTCGSNTGSTTWTNANRTVTVNCSDSASGCTQSTFSQTYSTDTKTSPIKIIDKAGNTNSCPVNVYVDKTAPATPTINMYKWANNSTRPTSPSGLSKYTASDWSMKKVYTQASGGQTDELSDIYYQYTTTGATTNATNQPGSSRNIEAQGTSTIQYRTCDKAGNCSAYTSPLTVKVDYTAPTCGSNTGSATWTKDNRTVTVNCSDSTSGCTQSTFSKTYKTDTKTSSITIKDNAGNTKSCSVNVYVDKTPPYTPYINIESTANNLPSNSAFVFTIIASPPENPSITKTYKCTYSNISNKKCNTCSKYYSYFKEIVNDDIIYYMDLYSNSTIAIYFGYSDTSGGSGSKQLKYRACHISGCYGTDAWYTYADWAYSDKYVDKSLYMQYISEDNAGNTSDDQISGKMSFHSINRYDYTRYQESLCSN